MAKPIQFEKAYDYEQAVQVRDVPKVMQIINGFKPGSIPTYAADALHFMCYYGSLDDIMTLIEKFKYPTDTQHSSRDYRYTKYNRYRGTLLHVVCKRDDGTEKVGSILEYMINDLGLSTYIPSSYGDGLPLHVACANDKNDVVRLVGVGCDVNEQDEAGNTPLHIACQHHNTDKIIFLVEKKCNLNVVNYKGESPLHLACQHHDLHIVQLVSVGCDVNRQDSTGNTPLHIACKEGKSEIIKYLVGERKCNVDVVNSDGEMPLHLLCKKCQLSIDDIRLVSVGCDINRQDSAGNTPLHIACIERNSNVIQFLVEEKKCNISVLSFEDKVPLDLVCNTKSHVNLESLLASIVKNYQYQHDVKSTQCALTLFKAVCNTCSTAGSGNVMNIFFQEAFIKSDFNACLCLMMVGQCDVYTQIDGIDKCDLVHTLLDKFTSEHVIACTRPTNMVEGDTILHVALYNWQDNLKLIQHLITVLNFSSSIENSRQEYPLHIACRLGCSLKVMELMGDCDVDHQDIDGNTPLHLVCLHHPTRDLILTWLVDSKHCSTNIVNRDGKKACELILDLSNEQTIMASAKTYLYVSKRSSYESLVSNGNTVLHMALKFDDEYLIDNLKNNECISYLSVRNIFNELPLHLAARTHDVGKVKLVSSGCSPDAVTHKGNTALHEVCRTCTDSDQDLEIVKFLCEDLKCNPNLSNLKGERPLHLACRQGSDRIVRYFLSELKVSDFDIRDNANCTPLMHAPLDRPEIVKLLVEYGADPQHLYSTYQKFFSTYSSENPPSTPLSIIVIGNHATGKSTLIKALKSEGCQDMVHAEAFTAGIIPSAYESKSFGSVIWYDLAGQKEYYASHEAILHTILSASPPLILLLVDIRKDLKFIQQDILYWLNFLHCQSHTKSVGTRPHLVIVFSFADIPPIDECEAKIKSVKTNLAFDFCKFQLEPVSLIALDCRMPNSDKIVSLRSQLSASFKELRGIARMNFILHCFYAFLLGNFKSEPAVMVSEVLALSEDWIESGIDPLSYTDADFDDGIDWDDFIFETTFEEKNPAKLLPVGQKEILRLCEELNNKGHIILIKHKFELEKYWVIIQKEIILNEVNGSLFAPQHFEQYCKHLSTNTGVVTYTSLKNFCDHYDPDMLIGFLTQLEFCQEIDDEVINQLLTDCDLKSHDSRFFFFPGLVSIEKPENIWKNKSVYSNKCGWIMETTQANKFFTPRFLQVLQLRIAFNFPLSVAPRRIIGFSPGSLTVIQRCCSVWKNGISWKTGGLECLVEVTEQCQAVVLMLRSISSSQDLTSHYISYRSSLIKVITSAVSDICPSLEVSESFCHPDHIQYPPQLCEDTALYSLPSIAHALYKQGLVSCDNPEYESIELEKLVTFEPFSHFNIHHLFNSSEKENVITDDYLRCISKSICSNEAGRTVCMMFTQEQNIPADLKLSADAIFEVLVDWRDSKHAMYSDLHCHLSQYSIFCDRDPQVRMECYNSTGSYCNIHNVLL